MVAREPAGTIIRDLASYSTDCVFAVNTLVCLCLFLEMPSTSEYTGLFTRLPLF